MNTPDSKIQATAKLEERFNLQPVPGELGLFVILEALLKYPGRILHEVRSARAPATRRALMVCSLLCLVFYGLVVGSTEGGAQLLIAPLKIVIGSALCALICLPSLLIFACLGGAEINLRSVAGDLTAAVSLMALLLVGFAPVAWVFAQSTDSVALMGFLHLVFWAVAFGFGVRLVARANQAADLRFWVLIYTVVCLQMMTSLRPIVGRSETLLPTGKKFFLMHLLETASAESQPRRK